MQAAAQAPSKADATRLRRKCQSLIALAEKLKANSTSSADAKELDLLDRSSKLHGNTFLRWESEPASDNFQLAERQLPFQFVDFVCCFESFS